jgi:hypothetical protein
MTAFRSPLNLALLAALVILTGAGFLLIAADKVLPIRWGFDLSVTESAPRNFALLQMPIAALLIWGVCWAFLRYGNAERVVRNAGTVAIVLPLVTGLFVAVQALILWSGLN